MKTTLMLSCSYLKNRSDSRFKQRRSLVPVVLRTTAKTKAQLLKQHDLLDQPACRLDRRALGPGVLFTAATQLPSRKAGRSSCSSNSRSKRSSCQSSRSKRSSCSPNNAVKLFSEQRHSDRVIESLAKMGFCDSFGNSKPNFALFQDSQYSAIARVSAILRGLACYYSFLDYSDKRRCMTRWSSILTHSLAMMFAAKFKLGSRSKVFALAGRNLQKPLKAAKRKKARLSWRAV